MAPTLTQQVYLTAKPKNKKIVFDDDGEAVSSTATETGNSKQKPKKKKNKNVEAATEQPLKAEEAPAEQEDEEEEDYFAKRDQLRLKQRASKDAADVSHKKWFNVYPQYPASEEVLELKENEQMELYNLCKNSFQAETPTINKRNPSDARWLQTALHRGTAKDRANAGALLVTSNPLGNLEALGTLISFTKPSNKSSTDVISILTDLWKEVLLPPQRKLHSVQMRGADWKLVRKDDVLNKEQQRRIYAYWHFESELKDHYFEFLKNLQMGMQTGQENNKNASIVSASQLLAYAPEKEQMLLTMLVNKLGDPVPKIASKALHHLTDVAHKHPNMCAVIVTEAEKLLFRNNISERAQHFALCFLSSIAPAGRPEVCSKLVHICFSLFKVLVQRGAVNNRTMQAILRCLQKAILEAQPATPGSGEVLSKDMQDTVYRLVHLADIRVSVQTLGLLLQLITVKTEKSDRFYNALYRKLLELELTNIGVKTAGQLLHIVHRAVHIDSNLPRAQAFIKRVLQLALYTPPHISAGCLIVIHKLLRSRRELSDEQGAVVGADGAPQAHKVSADDEELAKFDSDGEEKYEDVRDREDVDDGDTKKAQPAEAAETVAEELKPAVGVSSWHHAKVAASGHANETLPKVRDLAASKYDPYHRVPMFAGAELSLRNELLLLREHYHPTVQVFADNILHHKRINYYGDPLRDFGLPHFLERFAFKNPKKLDQEKAEKPTLAHKRYVAFGARGKPVKTLTKANCTEDEMYIFNFLEHKRQQAVVIKVKTASEEAEATAAGDDELRPGEVNDDDFENYLDGFFGKKAKAAAEAEAAEEEELDFLKELGGELQSDKKAQKKKKKPAAATAETEDGVADIDADWGDEDEGDDEAEKFEASDAGSDDEEGSVDLADEDDDGDDDDDGSISFDEDEDELSDNSDSMSDQEESGNLAAPRRKLKSNKYTGKANTVLNEKSFAKKLKHSTDMSSLFAAADDFADLLEETGKAKGQGTSNAVYNKDKSADKQMKWEQRRHSNSKDYAKKRGNKFGTAAGPGKKLKKH